MTIEHTIPSIVRGLSDEAVAAYRTWTESTVEKAEHLLDCRECDELVVRCPAGMLLADEEVRKWEAWNALRNSERAS